MFSDFGNERARKFGYCLVIKTWLKYTFLQWFDVTATCSTLLPPPPSPQPLVPLSPKIQLVFLHTDCKYKRGIWCYNNITPVEKLLYSPYQLVRLHWNWKEKLQVKHFWALNGERNVKEMLNPFRPPDADFLP